MALWVCEGCGIEFKRPPSGVKKHVFCSLNCSRKWQRENARSGKDHPQYKRIEIVCDECGKKFLRVPNRAKRGKFNFCSHECRIENFKKNNPHLGKAKMVKCGWCQKDILLAPSLIKDNSFCSFDCRSYWYSQNYSGENSPHYRDGQSGTRKRGRLWRRVSRLVKQRDENRCVVCGKTDGLVVHHIIPLYEWEAPEDSNRHWNLITLCMSCHGKVTNNDEYFLDTEDWDVAREHMKKFPVVSDDNSLVTN